MGLLDVRTVREDGPRLIGNVAIEVDARWRRPGGERVLARASRTTAGAPTWARGQSALGRVLRGHGNDGRSGLEGARTGNTIGTYLHGPLLPKNVWFADWLIARALGSIPASWRRWRTRSSARRTSAPAARPASEAVRKLRLARR